MYKEVLRSLDVGGLSEIGLLAFVVAFTLVIVYAFTLSKKHRDAAKQLPFDDDVVKW